MNQAVIVDSLRTGLAKSYRGGFNQTRADDMTAHLINTLLERHPQVEPGMVEDVILGCGYPEGSQGSNIARTSAVLSNTIYIFLDLAEWTGFEPATSCVTGRHSNQAELPLRN